MIDKFIALIFIFIFLKNKKMKTKKDKDVKENKEINTNNKIEYENVICIKKDKDVKENKEINTNNKIEYENVICIPINAGLGDVCQSIISCFVLSKYLNCNLKIQHKVFDLKSKYYFDLKKYFDIPEKYIRKGEKIDKIFNYNIFDKNHNKFIKNINFSNLIPLTKQTNLYKLDDDEKKTQNNICIQTSYNFYSLLLSSEPNLNFDQSKITNLIFKEILIPKKEHLDKINFYKKKYDLGNLLSIHIRCATLWGDDNTGEIRFDITKTVYNFIEAMKKLNYKGKVLLITDDIEYVSKIFEKEEIDYIFIEGNATHIKMSGVVDMDIEKLLMDLYLMSETKISLISYWSNFSKIGALRKMNNIYIVKAEIVEDEKKWYDSHVISAKIKNILYKVGNQNENTIIKYEDLLNKHNYAY